MSQKGKANKHLLQTQGDHNHVRLSSTDINILTNLGGIGKILKPLFFWIRDFLNKGAHIKRLQREVIEKDAEISRLKQKVISRIEKMFEAQQQVLSVRAIIQNAFDEVSSLGRIEQATYTSLQGILGHFSELADTRPCNRAGMWVGDRVEIWIEKSIKDVVYKQHHNFSIEDVSQIRKDLQNYFDWLHECLLVYAQPLYEKLNQINESRHIQSPFLYRDIFEHIQATETFDSLNDAELYWLERMLCDLKDNL